MTQLLQDKDRIFTNLFGHHSPDLEAAKQRGAWNGTHEILQQGPRLDHRPDESLRPCVAAAAPVSRPV